MAHTKRTILPEIQGLRAVAVGLVLIFHVWPDALPGGYVGVDVFFVISGYLITGLLVRSAMRDGHISLVDFYSRRARRLLPAASTVLAATFLGMFIFLPNARWEATATQIAASALYVQNWVLAWLSVDYLGSESAASPVQHYWSLSIEEQFYFVWPLVMIASIRLARRIQLPLRRIFIVALGLIFTASLAVSILLTRQEPAQAYFVTHTRMWELALGGLLALTVHRARIPEGWPRAAILAAGLLAIFWSAAIYSPETVFPGYLALVPTLGTAMVIIAGDTRVGFFTGLNAQWLTYVGDRSYSIYLWHWPMVVFYGIHQQKAGFMDGLGLIALTMFVSHYSYQHIEERYRHAKHRGEVRPLIYAAGAIFAFLGASGLAHNSSGLAGRNEMSAESDYPGPAALLREMQFNNNVEIIPSEPWNDFGPHRSMKCHVEQKSPDLNPCRLGASHSSFKVMLVGDSHAANWIPAFEELANKRGWELETHTKSACAVVTIPLAIRKNEYTSCSQWGKSVIDRAIGWKPDLIVYSVSAGHKPYHPSDDIPSSIRETWGLLSQSGAQIVAMSETPWHRKNPAECLEKKEECSTKVKDAKRRDYVHEAYKGYVGGNVHIINMNDAFCNVEKCPFIIGNVAAWIDKHHFTATYSKMLAPYIEEKLPSGIRAPGL